MKVTPIEVLIVALIIVFTVLTVRKQLSGEPTNYTIGVNGIVENRCINGYLFMVGERGQARQMVDAEGKGVRCE